MRRTGPAPCALVVLCIATAAIRRATGKAYDTLKSIPLSEQEAFEGQHTCKVTGKEYARGPEGVALRFCQNHNWQSCCTPAADLENEEFYKIMSDHGVNCHYAYEIRDLPLAELYCMNCDHDQPYYIRPEKYWDPGWPRSEETKHRPQKILICEEWTKRSFYPENEIDSFLATQHKKSGPASASETRKTNRRFEQCGLKPSSPCRGSDNRVIPGRDRYTCGDDVIVPTSMFAPLRHIENSQMYQFETFREAIEAFLNFESIGPPELDDDFGMVVVNRTVCTIEQLSETYKKKAYLPFAPPPTKKEQEEIQDSQHERKARENGPYCLRTADQIVNTTFLLPWTDPKTQDWNESTLTFVNSTWLDFFCRTGIPLQAPGGEIRYGGGADGSMCYDVRVTDPRPTANESHVRANKCCYAGLAWPDEKCFRGRDTAMALAPSVVLVAAALAAATLVN